MFLVASAESLMSFISYCDKPYWIAYAKETSIFLLVSNHSSFALYLYVSEYKSIRSSKNYFNFTEIKKNIPMHVEITSKFW